MVISLLLGGAGSGKSVAAERLVATLGSHVTYVATWLPSGQDPEMPDRETPDREMLARVAAHRARRPADWSCREVGADLAGALAGIEGAVLVDALGTWVAAAPGFAVDTAALCEALRARNGDTVIVSDEVGLGVHPPTEVGRRFREALGGVNQAVAGVADEVWLVVAGQVLPLTAPPWAGA
jgi:adenosylcobinamide kinase/adenosylcobinamide-phosphate guanylyltransferase